MVSDPDCRSGNHRADSRLSPANAAYPTFFPWIKPHLAGKPEILRYNELPMSVPNKEAKL